MGISFRINDLSTFWVSNPYLSYPQWVRTHTHVKLLICIEIFPYRVGICGYHYLPPPPKGGVRGIDTQIAQLQIEIC